MNSSGAPASRHSMATLTDSLRQSKGIVPDTITRRAGPVRDGDAHASRLRATMVPDTIIRPTPRNNGP